MPLRDERQPLAARQSLLDAVQVEDGHPRGVLRHQTAHVALSPEGCHRLGEALDARSLGNGDDGLGYRRRLDSLGCASPGQLPFQSQPMTHAAHVQASSLTTADTTAFLPALGVRVTALLSRTAHRREKYHLPGNVKGKVPLASPSPKDPTEVFGRRGRGDHPSTVSCTSSSFTTGIGDVFGARLRRSRPRSARRSSHRPRSAGRTCDAWPSHGRTWCSRPTALARRADLDGT